MPKINRVQIANYKSIEALDFEARRVTVFIGGPNTGKSNILESLALLSPGVSQRFQQVFRLRHLSELFMDQDRGRIVSLGTNDGHGWNLRHDRASSRYMLSFKLDDGASGDAREIQENESHFLEFGFHSNWGSRLRFYQFRPELFASSDRAEPDYLCPPFGSNLSAILAADRSLRESIASLFKSHGLRLEIRMHSAEILASRLVDDVLFSYPFDAVSETLRRITFLKAALETNTDAVLILDEPEANTFPFYTKYLAERIALDETNQFFLTTHNPYVLMSIIEKTPTADLAVYVTRMRDYRTEVRLLSGDELVEALDLGMDLFLNLDRYFEA